ncbi:putative methyltransferase [Medicago truncatula]|uniref:Caffeic acid O-methyltransferase n=1 Tax=Medicago truncatula TaxID=3880 RepID=A0A072V9H2_MEDTR|nr:isoliquiritigenin 2'-O-methyltransferase [Medicago truncatula]KEH38013.1 caffeic acid O-methyltransferase [Medicago truncatula]RHN74191.1 putative methyltransferase [Medicago truncatula]
MSSYTNGNGKVNNGDSSDTLSAMVLGSVMVLPAVLNAAIELKLFDIIATSNDGFMSVFEIASNLPNQHSDLPNRLDRVLCVLASYSLLSVSNRTNDDGTTLRVYGVTSSGKYFIDDENDGGYLGSFTPFTCHKALFGMWSNFKEVIVNEEIDLFKKVNGISMYEYFGKDSQINKIFNKSMTDTCNVEIRKIVEEYKGLEGVSTMVDVGGGSGQSLKTIIAKYPSIKGINFDLPQVIENAPPTPGIQHIGGSMFESVPQGDAILLKSVCHNWSDEQCIQILSNCHKALPPNGKVIIIELAKPDVPEPTDASRFIYGMDNIMFLTVGGKERTLKEYESLGKRSGFVKFQAACRVFSILEVMELYK